ncbi:MAG: 4'-phosphopantetheinyl transferase superfamily protein [Saprospiraceae bacterium]
MPVLYHKKVKSEVELGVWHVVESEDFFLKQLDFTPKEMEQLDLIKGRRRVDWLAVRHLLHTMSGREVRGEVLKDEYGKPYLHNSDWHISMSHSHDRAAIVASPKLVGIDIQYFVARIDRIAWRVLNQPEMDSLEDETKLLHMHVYWGAKEALYKAYGRKALDFGSHILIKPFKLDWEIGKTTGQVIKDDYEKSFEIHYQKDGEFILVWAVEGW